MIDISKIKPGDTVYVSFSSEVAPFTTESLLGVIAGLVQARIGTMHLLISTPGGSVMHGMNIYNILRGVPFKVVTHNVGNVDSVGNVIFLAGSERYSCAHATFMFHGVAFQALPQQQFDEKLLRERMDGLKADQDRIGRVIRDRTKLDANEVGNLFLEAKTRDPSYALASGIIDAVKEVSVPAGTPLIQLVFQR